MRLYSRHGFSRSIHTLFLVIQLLFPAFSAWAEENREPRDPLASTAFPPDSLITLEIDDPQAILRAFSRAGGLFPGRPGHPKTDPSMSGDQVVWLPTRSAASALVYSFSLPYLKGMDRAIGDLLARTEEKIAFGLIPRGRLGADPVLALTLARKDLPPKPPPGLHSAYVQGVYLLSPNPEAVKAAGYRLKAGPRRLRSSQPAPGSCLRVRVHELLFRRPRSGIPVLGILKVFLSGLPEEIEVCWNGTAETIHVRGNVLPRILEPVTGKTEFRNPYATYSIDGKIILPEGLIEIRDSLEQNPLGLLDALAYSWPTDSPDLATLSRHLTGRFKLVGNRSSARLIPVIGLETKNPRRALAFLRSLLVATGRCDEKYLLPGCHTFPLHMPYWLKDRILKTLFRQQINRVRVYQVGHAFGWIWLGPELEMNRFFRGIRFMDERDRMHRDSSRIPPGRGSWERLGEVNLSVSSLWNNFLEKAREDAASLYPHPSNVHETLEAVTSDLARSCGRLSYSVFREGDVLVLHRPVSLRKSLFPLLVARGARFWDTVQEKEQEVRFKARKCLRALHKARQAYHRLKGCQPDSLLQLRESGLWTERSDRVREAYAFHVVEWIPGKSEPSDFRNGGDVLYACPRSSGPSGWRPAFLILQNGRIFAGDPVRGGIKSMSPESLAEDGWRQFEPESTGIRDH